VVLIPLKLGNGDKAELKETWRRTHLKEDHFPIYLPIIIWRLWLPRQILRPEWRLWSGASRDPNWALFSDPKWLHQLWPHIQGHSFQGSEGYSNKVRGIFRISPFPHHPKCSHRPFIHSKRSQLEMEPLVLLMPHWVAQKSEI
jgi:hypothetical protein